MLYLPDNSTILTEVLSAYSFPSTLMGAVRYGHGHINDTYCVICQPQDGDCIRYILQGLSATVFPHPEMVMENMSGITDFLRIKICKQGGNPERQTLTLVKTIAGNDYYTDSNGKIWRLTLFVEGTDCFMDASPELFEASAYAFGNFQYMLRDYPAETLHEVIPKFHDTEDRFQKLLEALKSDKIGRACQVQSEIEFALARKEDCSVVMQAQRSGRLPLRVSHNDTKLNNILFDRATGEGICIIDLDTTMPGLSVNDFGDSIRFGANHCADDETDLSKVNFDITLFESYTRGYLKGAQGSLTPDEIAYLPWGARLMTLECGIRFLTDYLNGDQYFRIHYPQQNLNRCRTQFKLVRDMESQFQAMCNIVQKYATK